MQPQQAKFYMATSDMPSHMQAAALRVANAAQQRGKSMESMAQFIKSSFDAVVR